MNARVDQNQTSLSAAKTAILKTLAYREVFEYPMTFYQLYVYLISDEPVDFEEYKSALRQLLVEKKIVYGDGYFHAGALGLVVRAEREDASSAHLRKAAVLAGSISRIPWVKLIGVTGAVSAGNAPKEDDIDVFIVSSSSHVWTVRFLTVLYLKLRRLYRSDSAQSGKFCPNLFVSEDALLWEHAISSYIAHEIYMMKSVFDRGDYYFRFLSANLWAKDFLPHVKFQVVDGVSAPAAKSGFVEKLLKKIQLWYMSKKITNEIMSDKVIHFRRDDNSGWIQASFANKFREVLGR